MRLGNRTFVTLLTLCQVAVGLGCQSQEVRDQPVLFFPAAPAEPRIQFLMWASGAEQVEPKKSSFQDFILGEEPGKGREINKPYGVAAHEGVIYVCDTKGLALCRLDFKNNSFKAVGTRGPGRLRKPINIVIDPMGYKFVVDPVRKQVVVFGPTDEYVTAFDIPEPCKPVDAALYGNELYVLDNDDTPQIVVLDRSSGEVLRSFGKEGGDPGEFHIPNSLAIDKEGNLYVSDTHNWRIQKLTRDGESIWAKGTPGYRLGQFGRPRGIRVGPDGLLYVVDGATEIVQMFDPDGNILMRFGGPGSIPGALDLPSTLAVDTTSLPYFQKYVHEDFAVEYLLIVANQYGPHLINVYAFGSFPEGYELTESLITTLPRVDPELGIAPLEARTRPADYEAGDSEEQPPADEQD